MFGERALHTRRKGLQNKIEKRVEEGDKAAYSNGEICWQYNFVNLEMCELRMSTT